MGLKGQICAWIETIQPFLKFCSSNFLIFCMNGLTLKWFRLMYKVDNFDPYWAKFLESKGWMFAWFRLIWSNLMICSSKFFVFSVCRNNLGLKWFRLVYKFDNFDPYWAWHLGSKGSNFCLNRNDLAIS